MFVRVRQTGAMMREAGTRNESQGIREGKKEESQGLGEKSLEGEDARRDRGRGEFSVGKLYGQEDTEQSDAGWNDT